MTGPCYRRLVLLDRAALKFPSCGRNAPAGYFGSSATLLGPSSGSIPISKRGVKLMLANQSRLKISHACSRHRLAFLNIPERLGGNENSVGCPLIDLAPDEFMKTPSNIWLLAPLMLGNVFPSSQ